MGTDTTEATDEQVAAWIPTQNRGVPPWAALDEEARDYWRLAYARAQHRQAAS